MAMEEDRERMGLSQEDEFNPLSEEELREREEAEEFRRRVRREILRVQSGEADEDIYLDEFADEIDQWVIDAIKSIGLDTAKAVLNAPREMLIEKADLEEETVDHVLNVLRAEFEN